tara:strand:- start:1278 stop:1709 length:432 start_codon:yes stop_codon:yes gene_type:complete
MKDFLYWNNLQNQLRTAQGVPEEIPTIPNENSTSSDILDFCTNTIFHVSQQNGARELVHLLVSSPENCTIFVRVISSNYLTSNGSKTRVTQWPTTIDALAFKIRSNQPSPTSLLSGYEIRNGAAISLMSTAPGARAFGFTVKN